GRTRQIWGISSLPEGDPSRVTGVRPGPAEDKPASGCRPQPVAGLPVTTDKVFAQDARGPGERLRIMKRQHYHPYPSNNPFPNSVQSAPRSTTDVPFLEAWLLRPGGNLMGT